MTQAKEKKKRRLSRWDGQRGTALLCLLLLLGWSAGPLQAAVTVTTLPLVTTVSATSIINDNNQSNLSTGFTAINQAAVPVNVAATGVVSSAVDDNALYSRILANVSTLSTDLGLVSGNAPGSALASVNAQSNISVTAHAEVNGSSVTSTLTNPGAGSAASLAGNSIAAETSLNTTEQTVQGAIDTTFDSSHAGRATVAATSPLVDGDGGIFAGSAQFNLSVTPIANESNFAEVSGNSIALTVGGTLGDSLSLEADANSISAAFTGNNAKNLLAVETGGATALTSSAGIANLQVNDGVAATDSALTAESAIAASVLDNPLLTSSLSFEGNQIKASATGSVADNRLTVEAGLNVDADGDQQNRLDFTPGSESSVTRGGLFLNNMQLADGSPVSATATDPAAGAALSVDSRGLIDSTLHADGNSFEAIALGNDAYSSILVGGATSFTGAVAASNLQGITDSPVTATASAGTLAVNLGGSAVSGGTTAVDNVTGSTISVNDNTVSALAVGNRDPLLVSVTGTAVNDAQNRLVNLRVINADQDLASTAAISAISSQMASGSNVTASNTGAGINLIVAAYPTPGIAGAQVNTSTLNQSGNSLTSLANINEGLVAVGISATNLDASSAAASVQNAADSDSSATTSGKILTGVNARQLVSGSPEVNNNLSILVGDNTIASTAGGNLNATALDVAADTTLAVTGAIDRNGASSTVLELSSAPDTNRMIAEMAILTDQRLADNLISATTQYSQIGSVVRRSGFAISDSQLTVEDNQVTATARGNLTSNSLDFSALSIDLSGAEAGGQPAGTNLAAMGAVQAIGAGSSVTATIEAQTYGINSPDHEIIGKVAGGGDLTNVALSVDNNAAIAAAHGNRATSRLSGSGGALSADAPGDLYGVLAMLDEVWVTDTALANAVVQVNAGTVAANLGTGGQYQITGILNVGSDTDITNSTLSVDDNRVLALATGSNAVADTTLAFTTLESSAATAVQQIQTGATIASVGGSGGGVEINALTHTQVEANLINSTISASGNSAGAQATGATSAAGLTAGGEDTVTLASGYSNTAAAPSATFNLDTGATTLSADYMVGMQQVIVGWTSASAHDLSVYVQGGNLAGGSLTADGNFLTAQATGGSSTGNLTLAASDMTAAGVSANTVNGALVSEQFLAGPVLATLSAADVSATVVDLTTAATGTNNAEAVSVDGNTLLAAGTGLNSVNNLTTAAGTSVAGGAAEPVLVTDLLAAGAIGNVDRLIVSFQDVQAGGAVTVSASVTGVAAAVSSSVNGDSLTVDGNKLLAQGTGAASSNTLATSAGTAISDLTQAIVAGQDLDGAVTVSNSTSAATLDISGTSTDASLSVSNNQFGAAATGLTGANTMSLAAPASISDTIGSLYTHDIASVQLVNAPVTANLSTSEARLYILGGDVTGSALKVDGNLQDAAAQGATNANTLTAESGAISDVGFQIGAYQYSEDPVIASNLISRIALDINDGAATGASLSLSGNGISATAGNLNGVNTLSVDSLTANTGDTAVIDFVTMTLAGGRAEADRTIASIQDVTAGGDVEAVVNSPHMIINVWDELQGNSSAYLTGNSIAATATVANSDNTLNNSAETFLNSSSLIASYQASLADATASVDGAWLNIHVDYPINDSKADLSDNRVTATATGLTAANTLEVAAGSIAGTMVNLPAGGIVAVPLAQDMDGFSAIGSDQSIIGDISATIRFADLGVYADDYDYSTVHVDDNLVQASATQASAGNSLTQAAETAMVDAPALLAAAQAVSGSAYAEISDGWIMAYAYEGIDGSTVTADGNRVIASAMGGTLTNTLEATAGTMAGSDPMGQITAATAATDLRGFSLLSSAQTVTGDLNARILDSAGMGASVYDNVSNSTIHVDDNRVQAASTMASATNTLMQLADTSMADAPALLSASQNLTGSSSATVDAWVWIGTYLDYGDLSASNLTADRNSIQAVATGGTLTNYVDPGAGTSIVAQPLAQQKPDPSVGTMENRFDGTYGLSSRQNSFADVTASIGGEYIEINLELADGSVFGNSALSVSDNSIRSLATNLSASNTLVTAAGTALDDIRSGVLSYQEVTGATSATVLYADVWAGASGDLSGTASVDRNRIAAVATGGTVSNALDVSGMTISGSPAGANSSLTTTSIVSPAAVSGDESHNSLLNVQTRSGSVDARMNDTDGNLAVSASFANVTGNVGVSNNLMAAQARGLEADNSLKIASLTQIDGGSTALGSVQAGGSAAVTASVTGSPNGTSGFFLYSSGDFQGTAKLDGNTVQAAATANLAVNSLNASAGTQILNMGSETTTSIGVPISAATAGLALQNTQSGSAPVTATVNNVAVLTSLGTLNGTAGVNNNTVLAQSRGQAAQNSLALNAGTTLNASASLVNSQINAGPVGSSITGVGVGLTAGSVTGASSVGNNTVQASGTANLAINSMDITGGTLAAATGGSTGALTATADYVALNHQNNLGDVSTSVNGAAIALANNSTSGSASVLNNAILADATGNSAINRITLSTPGTATADVAFNGFQNNIGASVSSSISGASISLSTTGVGSFRTSGNRIGATATGNASVSSISTRSSGL